MEVLSTAVAAAALTGASRLLEALIRRSSFLRRPKIDDEHGLHRRLSVVESKLNEMRDLADLADLDWRVRQVEIEARRHEWLIGRRASQSGGRND